MLAFTLATSERWTDGGGNRRERTDWHNVVVRNRENLAPHIKKGMRLAVTGSVRYREYVKDGQTVRTTEIAATDIEFLEKKQERDGGGRQADNLELSGHEPEGVLAAARQKAAVQQNLGFAQDDLPF